MADLKIYHNPNCSKSLATLQLIQERGLTVNIINYLKNPPTAAEKYCMLNGLDEIGWTLQFESLIGQYETKS